MPAESLLRLSAIFPPLAQIRASQCAILGTYQCHHLLAQTPASGFARGKAAAAATSTTCSSISSQHAKGETHKLELDLELRFRGGSGNERRQQAAAILVLALAKIAAGPRFPMERVCATVCLRAGVRRERAFLLYSEVAYLVRDERSSTIEAPEVGSGAEAGPARAFGSGTATTCCSPVAACAGGPERALAA